MNGQVQAWEADALEPMSPTDQDRALDVEFAFITWQESCRDPHPTLQQCRRRAGHEGQHAAGFGAGRHRWDG